MKVNYTKASPAFMKEDISPPADEPTAIWDLKQICLANMRDIIPQKNQKRKYKALINCQTYPAFLYQVYIQWDRKGKRTCKDSYVTVARFTWYLVVLKVGRNSKSWSPKNRRWKRLPMMQMFSFCNVTSHFLALAMQCSRFCWLT